MSTCEHPIYIRNKDLLYVPGKTKKNVPVPCNRCQSCQNAKRDQWFIRSFAEIKKATQAGGFSLMITLTYDNRNLPWFHSSKDKGYHIPGFNHDHINRFLHYLERDLLTHYGLKRSDWSYLITSEYGENTQRPHYHGILNIFKKVSLKYPVSHHRVQWSKTPREVQVNDKVVMALVCKRWIYGHVFPDPLKDHETAVIQSHEAGALYVAKYVNKDVAFYGRRDLQAYFLNVKKDGHDRIDRKKAIKKFLPRHWQSNGYGDAIISDFLNASDSDRIDMWVNGIALPLSTYRYQMPLYFKDKLIYENRAEGGRQLNSFGQNFKSKLYNFEIDALTRALTHQMSCFGLRRKLSDSDAQKWLLNGDIPSLNTFLYSLLNNRSVRDLAIFSKVYYDVEKTESYYNYHVHEHANDIQYFIDIAQDLYDARIWSDHKDIFEDNFYSSATLAGTYNELPCFQGFAKILDILRQISSFESKRVVAAKKVEEDKAKRLVDFFKN